MINLREKDTDRELGSISEAQFQFLVDQLEEESMEDNDYAISKTMLDYFESQGADPELVSLLRNALAGRDEMDIVWSKISFAMSLRATYLSFSHGAHLRSLRKDSKNLRELRDLRGKDISYYYILFTDNMVRSSPSGTVSINSFKRCSTKTRTSSAVCS